MIGCCSPSEMRALRAPAFNGQGLRENLRFSKAQMRKAQRNSAMMGGLQMPEVHSFMFTPGGIKRANYNGPFTKLTKRLKAGDEGINFVDNVSKLHDLQYATATSDADTRRADERMLRNLARAKKEKLDHPINIKIGELPIRAKMAAENRGLLSKTAFNNPTANMKKNSKADLELFKQEEAKLIQQGYGQDTPKKPLPPGLALRRKLLASKGIRKKKKQSKREVDLMADEVREIMKALKFST